MDDRSTASGARTAGHAGCAQGGRIVAVEVLEASVTAKTLWRFVELRTDAGLVGLGEFTAERVPPNFAETMRAAAALLLGAPATRAALSSARALVSEGFAGATLYSALDQALADLEARAAGLSIAAHLGGTNAPVPLYANINRRTVERTPQGFAASARLAVSAGFSRLKLAPFDGLTPDLCGTAEGERLVGAGLARVEAVAAAAPGASVMVDCHWRFTPRAAHAVLPALQAAGVAWFECPLPESADVVSDLARLRGAANAKGMRLAGLETMATWDAFAPFVVGGAYDVVMPDIKHCGGYDTLIEIAERAAQHGVATSAHNPSGPVAHAHSLHATACLPGGEALEVQFDETPLFDALTTPAPPPREGMSALPEGPGLGLALDRSATVLSRAG